jgi:hypothetical protein
LRRWQTQLLGYATDNLYDGESQPAKLIHGLIAARKEDEVMGNNSIQAKANAILNSQLPGPELDVARKVRTYFHGLPQPQQKVGLSHLYDAYQDFGGLMDAGTAEAQRSFSSSVDALKRDLVATGQPEMALAFVDSMKRLESDALRVQADTATIAQALTGIPTNLQGGVRQAFAALGTDISRRDEGSTHRDFETLTAGLKAVGRADLVPTLENIGTIVWSLTGD